MPIQQELKKEEGLIEKLKSSYTTFEDSLQNLLKKAKQKPISAHDLLSTLSGRGKIFMLITLSLGFSQIPGTALFFGIFIAYLGTRIAIGSSFIWLPKFLLNKNIPSSLLVLTIPSLIKSLKFTRKISRPRYQWATQLKSTHIISGIMLAIIGISMAISPPVPLSGWIACFAVFFLAIGLLNNDCIYIILGVGCAIFYLLSVIFLLNYCSVSQMIEGAKYLKNHLFIGLIFRSCY